MESLPWREILIALNTVDGIQFTHLSAIKDQYKSEGPRILRHASRLAERTGLRPNLARRVAETDLKKVISSERREIAAHHLKTVTIDDPDYPPPLKDIYSPPPLLYMQGTYEMEDHLAIAIVGARQADYRGKSLARTIAASLAKRGITIVSGLARGIDTQAHLGALEAGGRTIGVLGSGFSHFYPSENKDLGAQVANRGCVISEFPCNWRPEPRNFPRRNRIISGLAKGVVVVQAARRSGSLITARLALEQGKEVFALPGPPESPLSRGCNALIKQGAKLVENVGDILEELALPLQAQAEQTMPPEPKLTGMAARLYEHLSTEPMQIDQLCEVSEIDPKDALPALLSLELSGLIVHLPGQFFARKITDTGDKL